MSRLKAGLAMTVRVLFYPATAAMNRMNYVVKFVFIGLLLLLPFAYVTHLMVKGSDQQIIFNQKESYGVDYITPVSRLLGHLQDCRTYSAAVLSGDEALWVELLRERKEADALIKEIDEIDARYREDLRTTDGQSLCSNRWKEIKVVYSALREQSLTNQEESFAGYTEVCTLLTDLILNYVANYSNLILDPDLDSYWLMDAFVGKMPQIAESMSQACALSIAMADRRKPGEGASGSLAPLTSEEKLGIHGLYIEAINSLKALHEVNLKTAFAHNNTKSKTLQPKIESLAREATTLSREFLDRLKSQIIRPEAPLATPRELVDAAQKAMDASYALYAGIGPELKSLIDTRVTAYKKEKTLGVIAAESATFLHVYLFIAFYLAINASVAQIATFTKRMIEGTREHFKLDSRDELGKVAESYNQINAALVEVRELKTLLESRTGELQESEERFRTLASRAPVGIFMTDPRGECLYVNDQWCRYASLTLDEAKGNGWVRAIHAEDRERVTAAWNAAAGEGRDFASEYRFSSPNGVVWLSGNAVVLRDRAGAIKGFLGSVTDITEQKRVEKLKNEFISTVSHELRTPLTSIRGSLGLIGSGVVGALPAKAKPMIEIATKNCERLVRLVSDILDVEKIATGLMPFKLRTLSLSSLIPQVVESNRGFAESLGISLKVESEISEDLVRADVDRLTQVLTNLISNACKFSPRGETVTIGLRREGERMRVSVQDRGLGIPKEFRPRIFQKFAQADASDAGNRKGTGLGLAISKGLIEKMNGSIGFETKTGAGTTFFFLLDVEKPVASSRAAEPGDRKRILVCEDEAEIAEILKLMLKREGYDCDVAATLKEARERLKEGSYSGVTLDLSLPDGNGILLLRELRQNPATAHLPVTVISANVEQGREALTGQAIGLVDWLEKPIPEDRLREALHRSCPPASGRRARVLHAEDDPDIAKVISNLLQDVAEVVQADTVMSAWERLKQEDFDLLIIDVGMPDGSGLELLPALKKSTNTPIPALVFSAHEISPRTAKYVSAALLKSKTSNEEFVSRVVSLLGKRAPTMASVPSKGK